MPGVEHPPNLDSWSELYKIHIPHSMFLLFVVAQQTIPCKLSISAQNMAFLSLTGFVTILMVLHALWDSSAHAADQHGRKMHRNMVMVRKENVSPALVAAKQTGFGGRKLLTKKLEDVTLGNGLKEEESAKKSENAKNADLVHKEESNRVVEADDREVMQTAGHGDYPGTGRIKSRHNKPPINNNEPTD